MLRQTAIGIYSTGKILLDGVIAAPSQGTDKAPAILMCHPHPMLGGDMNSPVLLAASALANEHGLATLRFDFRGVGRSEGEFSNGKHEGKDVERALAFLANFPGVDGARLGILGYSFGASVLLRALPRLKRATCFALVSPPLSSVKDRAATNDKRVKLFLTGQDDAVVPSATLQRLLDDMHGPVQFTEIPDADHRLRGCEQAAAERVVDFMLQHL